MYGKMKDFLSQTLAEIKEAGLYKEERLIESAQQAAITVKGRPFVSSAEHKIYTRNWKLPSLSISKRKIRFCTQPASMQTVVYSNRSSLKKTPSSRTL